MRNRVFYWAILACALFLSAMLLSCSGPHAIAERKLRKALRLDPNIVADFNKDTTLYRLLKLPVTFTAPAVDVTSRDFNCDSLMSAFARLSAAESTPGNSHHDSAIYIYRDSTGTNIQVKKKGNGQMAVAFHVPPRQIHDTVSYRDTLKITVNGRVLKTEVKAPCYKYFWFWGLVAALVLETILFVRSRSGGKGVVINEQRTTG